MAISRRLTELSALASMHDAMLVVDEAHATGIFGARGRGCAGHLPQDRVVSVHTCGKALGRGRRPDLRICAHHAII